MIHWYTFPTPEEPPAVFTGFFHNLEDPLIESLNKNTHKGIKSWIPLCKTLPGRTQDLKEKEPILPVPYTCSGFLFTSVVI